MEHVNTGPPITWHLPPQCPHQGGREKAVGGRQREGGGRAAGGRELVGSGWQGAGGWDDVGGGQPRGGSGWAAARRQWAGGHEKTCVPSQPCPRPCSGALLQPLLR